MRPPKMPTYICEICGKVFTTTAKGSTCSRKCKDRKLSMTLRLRRLRLSINI